MDETTYETDRKVACPVCSAPVWALDGALNEHVSATCSRRGFAHQCAASWAPVVVERCERCDGDGLGRGIERGDACGFCLGLGAIATRAAGPPVPDDLSHPRNANV